jgi:hemolysin activation/secretion protein
LGELVDSQWRHAASQRGDLKNQAGRSAGNDTGSTQGRDSRTGPMSRARLSARTAAAMALVLAGTALAQVRPPDAGRVLEDSRTGGPPQPPRAAPRLDLEQPVRPALTAPDSFRVQVKGFRITRNTVFTEKELTPLLKAYVDRELSLADLEEAAAAISRFYRERGYFVARAYVPAQEISEGIVEITVLEGRLGAVQIFVPPGSRDFSSPRVVRGILAARQPPGSVIRNEGLERALLLLSDTPGVSARATLLPGAEPGTSDLSIDVADTPVVSGGADADTFGNRFTGAARIGASGQLNSPTGIGDVATVRMQVSSGSQNARLGYQIPLTYDGLRLGASYSIVRYKLCCDFAALQANGDAGDLTATAQYPFVRSRIRNVYGTLSISGKHFVNRVSDVIAISDKTTRALVLGASVDDRDERFGGGLNAYSLAVTSGKLDLSSQESDRVSDSITAQADGGYSKVNYALSRLQRLGATMSLYLSLSGQFASKNLDSSEQFSLGGPTGVRAYPTGEAIGDEGMLVTVEGRWQIAENWQASAFQDRGTIRLHKNPWAGWEGANTTITNSYSINGAGLGLTYSTLGNFTVRMFAAMKIGSNLGRNASGNDADNRNSRFRAWIQAIKYF